MLLLNLNDSKFDLLLNLFKFFKSIQSLPDIPKNHSGISKTLRLPEDVINEIQHLANMKNLSFNKAALSLLIFSLENLDEKDKEELKRLAQKDKDDLAI